MVQKRGGKRQATTPVGGTYKDARRNIQGNEDYDDEEEQYTTVIRRQDEDRCSEPRNSYRRYCRSQTHLTRRWETLLNGVQYKVLKYFPFKKFFEF